MIAKGPLTYTMLLIATTASATPESMAECLIDFAVTDYVENAPINDTDMASYSALMEVTAEDFTENYPMTESEVAEQKQNWLKYITSNNLGRGQAVLSVAHYSCMHHMLGS